MRLKKKIIPFLLLFFSNHLAAQDSIAVSWQRQLIQQDSICQQCLSAKNSDCLVNYYLNIGNVYAAGSQYKRALENYNLALVEVEAKKQLNDLLLYKIYLAKGNLFRGINDFENARIQFKKTIPHIPEKKNIDYYRAIYLNISSTFIKADSIIFYSSKIIEKCNDSNVNRICQHAYNNMANAFLWKKMPEKASEILTQNLNLQDVPYTTDDNLLTNLLHTLGLVHYELRHYETAIKYYEQSLAYSLQEKNLPDIIDTKEDLSKSYEALGDNEKALQLMRELQPLQAEYNEVRLKKELAKLEAMRLLAQQEEQINDLEKENQQIEMTVSKTKMLLYALGLFLILALVILLYNKHKSQVQLYQFSEELSLNRMKSLRSMMNPHFLFNSFSTLQNFILKKQHLKANEYMTDLSELIRLILDNSESIYMPLEKEIDLLKAYVKMEQSRFEEKFVTVFDINDQLLVGNLRIPSMIIQPYVENAILHGFSQIENQGILKISFEQTSNTLVCLVRDNGIGRPAAEQLKKRAGKIAHLSLATRNTDERLRILSRLGKENAQVQINDLMDKAGNALGTEVIIKLPIL